MANARAVGTGFLIASLVLLVLVAVAYAAWDRNALSEGPARLALWITLLLLVAAFFVGAGWMYADDWRGILISRQNRYSLSQLQFLMWTWLFASATLALFLIRLRAGPAADGLDFAIPLEAPILMGVSTVSLGTAVAIKARKRVAELDPEDLEKARRAHFKHQGDAALRKLGLSAPQARQAMDQIREAWKEVPLAQRLDQAKPKIPLKGLPAGVDPMEAVRTTWKELERSRDGALFRNGAVSDASLRNLIEGDEFTNASNLDFGKLQLLAFSLIALVAYAVVLAMFFLEGELDACGLAGGPPCLDGLPGISEGLVGILGASHVGYLTTKAAGTSRTL